MTMKTRNLWMKNEINILRKEYPKQGAEISELLKRHTINSICDKAHDLKIKKPNKRRWTPKQLKILKEKYSKQGSNIPELLEKHPSYVISAKAAQLEIKYTEKWTKGEIGLLKERWKDTEPHQWLYLLPKRTYYSIKRKAHLMGLKRDLIIFSKKKKFKCEICGKEFEGYGNRVVCSTKCNAIYSGGHRLGENNPAYDPNKYIKINCLNCGLEFEYAKGGNHGERKFCSNKCSREYHVGDKAPHWMGGISFYPYSHKFNKILKEKIKKRDGNKCIFCHSDKIVDAHHIDYDKMNCSERNLITLCRSCHSATNCNRYFWRIIFRFIMSGYKIIKKNWGFELIPISTQDYCLKLLVFYTGLNFSDHYHKIKSESWFCLFGKLHAKLTQIDGTIEEFIFNEGDVLEIPAGLCHRLSAMEPTILIEISSKDSKIDNYRIEKSRKIK